MLAVTFPFLILLYNGIMTDKTTLSEFFKSQGKPRHFAKGQLILATNERLNEVLEIRSGLVKVYDVDPYGNERTVTIFGKGHFFPLVWLLKQHEEVIFFYQAISDVDVQSVSYESVVEFISDRNDILLDLVDKLTKAFINQDGRIYNLQHSNVREKLEFVLYHLGVRVGRVENNVAIIPGIITRAEIANLAGCSRESISRELNNITAAGLMWKKDGKTYVDFSKMKSKYFHKVYKV